MPKLDRRGALPNWAFYYFKQISGARTDIFCIKMLTRSFLLASFALLCIVAAQAQTADTSCGGWHEPITRGPQDQPPVIFGDRQLVPAMRVRLDLSDARSAVPDRTVTVNDGWRWLEYPYPEHSWGVWSDAADQTKCTLDRDGWIQVPPHEVRPRGWYDGKYTRFPWPHRPSFTGIEIVAVTKGGFARIKIQPRELKKFSDSDLIVRVSDGWRTQLSWQPKNARPLP